MAWGINFSVDWSGLFRCGHLMVRGGKKTYSSKKMVGMGATGGTSDRIIKSGEGEKPARYGIGLYSGGGRGGLSIAGLSGRKGAPTEERDGKQARMERWEEGGNGRVRKRFACIRARGPSDLLEEGIERGATRYARDQSKKRRGLKRERKELRERGGRGLISWVHSCKRKLGIT